MTNVRRFFVAGLLAGFAAFAAPPTRGADLVTELDELADAVTARIAAADGTKEAKRLAKARKKLEGIDPATAGATEVGAVLKAVFGAKSVDPGLVAAATDVVRCLQTLVEGTKDESMESLDDLRGTYRSKAEAKFAGADSKLAEAAALVASDPKKAGDLLLVAFGKFTKTVRYADRALDLQELFGACGALGNSTGMQATVTGPGGFRRTFSGFASGAQVGTQLGVDGCKTGRGTSTCESGLFLNLTYPAGSRARGPVTVNLVRYFESSDFGNGNGSGVQDLTWVGFSPFEAEISESTATLLKGCFRGTVLAETAASPASLTIEGTFVVRRPK